jgi:23S rRNA pseudouridine1911/1915/1917 synthase
MAAIGHPVIGDDRYGERAPSGLARGRFFLHAFELGLDHPADGRRVSYRAELPDDLVALLPERPELP